jgi:hypothetical protein
MFGGYYDVYVTLARASGGPSPGPNNNATVNWAITNVGPTRTGTVTLAPSTSGLPDQWLKLNTSGGPVGLEAGQNFGVTFFSPGTPTNRFCVDAVRFELVGFGPPPLPVSLSTFEVD